MLISCSALKTLLKKVFYLSSGKISENILIAIVMTIAVFAPDFVMNGIGNTHIINEPLFNLYVFAFMFLLSFCPLWSIYLFLFIFFAMQTVQLNFMAFFGHPITAGEIINIVSERADVFDVSYLKQTWFVMPVLLLFFGTAVFILHICQKNARKAGWILLAVLYLAAHKPYRAFTETKGIWYFQPGPTRSSLKNSINTFSYFFFQYLRKDNKSSNIDYKPYYVKDFPTERKNVLLIFGESLYSRRLPMFGYERNTFPKMKERLEKEKNIQAFEVLSSGIATAVSTSLFFNVVREPGNLKEIKNQTANMFRIAKQNGFETYYISNQESRLLMDIGDKYVDHIINNDSEPLVFGKMHDEGLLHFLKQINLQEKPVFVVLHMRSPHLPYEKHYKKRKEEFEKFLPAENADTRLEYYGNTYDNALLYTDNVIDEIVSTFKEQNKNRKNVTFITADHGQLFDFNGLWGHNNLVVEQSYVPGFVIGDIKNKPAPKISAYQFGKMVLHELGGTLVNENEDEGRTYYLHGNNIEFPYDYIEYQIMPDSKIQAKPAENTENLKNRTNL